MYQISKTHFAKTWLLHENAPEVVPPEAVIRRRRVMPDNFEKPIMVVEGGNN